MSGVLLACHARVIRSDAPERSRAVTAAYAMVSLMLLATLFDGCAVRYGLEGVYHRPAPTVSWCLFLLVALASGLTAADRVIRPRDRGRLLLREHELVFQRTLSGREIAIPLTGIEQVSRKTWRLHVTPRGAGHSFYFACSPLRAEDMYDCMLARFDELRLEVTHHESPR